MKNLLKINFWLFLGILACNALLEVINDNLSMIGFIPNIPGLLLYVLTTGDIHDWHPGPLGRVGRVLVTSVGTSVFWSLIVWIVRIIRRKRSAVHQ
jgi:hypothetical protein